MATLTVQRESTEYLYVGITGTPPDTADLAFLPAAVRPGDSDWHTAILVTDEHPLWDDARGTGIAGDYYAAALVGPDGGIELTAGFYRVWARLDDADETPVKIAPDTLKIG